jgi:protein SCO1
MLRRALQLTTGLLIGLALVASILWLTPPPPSDLEWVGASAPPAPYPAPPLELVDVHGEVVNLASFRGRHTVVFFGYTNCPDVCPATLLNLSGALSQMSRRDADRLQVVFVTLDPERDTPERLGSWMQNFHPDILALSGTEESVRTQAARWGVHAATTPVVPIPAPTPDPHAGHQAHDPGPWGLPDGLDEIIVPGAPGAYAVEHSTRSFVVDRQGRIVLFLAPFQGADAMLADLRRAMRR